MSTAIRHTSPSKDAFQELIEILAKGYHRLSLKSDWREKTAKMQPRDRQPKPGHRHSKKIVHDQQN